MSFGERLEALINDRGLNHSSFAKILGENRQRISHIIAVDSSPNYSLIEKILSHYPDLSAEWLCRGKGEMWLAESGNANQSVNGNSAPDNAPEELYNYQALVKEVKKLREEVNTINKQL